MNVPAQLIEALNTARRPGVAGHVNPDVDALGSMLALTRAMPADGAAVILADQPVSAKLMFLLELAGCPIADAGHLARADVIVVLDTASPERTHVPDGWEAIADKLVVNIDHHISNTDFGQINWVVYNATDDRTPEPELKWSLRTNATWLSFHPGTTALSGKPTAADVGSYWVAITVDDGEGGMAGRNFTLTVYKPGEGPGPGPSENNKPVLSNGKMTPTSGDTDTTFTFSIEYEDEDGDIPESIVNGEILTGIPRKRRCPS